MTPTVTQITKARAIDKRVRRLLKKGGDEALLEGMHPIILKFKPLLGSTDPAQFDNLCTRFSGFNRFAQLLSLMAAATEAGELDDILGR